MSEREIPMEELGPTEDVRSDPGPDPGSTGGTTEVKASKKALRPASSSCISCTSASSQRRRLTGGASLLRNLARRGSFGSFLNESFDPSDPNAMEGQKHILKSPVELTIDSHTRSRFLFLCEDALICAKQKSPTNFHTKHRIDLRDLWLGSDVPDSTVVVSEDPGTTDEGMASETGVGMDNCCLTIGWPTVHAMLKFPSSEERDAWRSKLQELMELVQEKESPHTIVRIVQNDESYSVTKSMMVKRCETAKMVIARCIEEFHIQNETPSNFQLSVLKTKNDLPIPLTGHEILYRIQMKQNREQQHEFEKDTSAEMELEPGEGLVFQLTPSEKKTNVLKRTLASEDGKPAKRASSLTRFFRTTFRLHDDGKLFRRNLSELCKDGKLCWRLMMMLSHLFVHGPTFEEVFRKPPSIKVHRVLQDRLDRSKDFNFDNVNACEMSHLLKSFLNCLPECLLTFELYPKWAEASQMEDKKEALMHYKRLVNHLPDCNRVLLRHLICVLHRISIYHMINGMPPKSLSICVGQSILWLPPPLKPAPNEASSDINKALRQLGIANSVTETLIESADEIFGVKVLHLFDHLSTEATTALAAADAHPMFRAGMHGTRAVSDYANKEPVNGDLVSDILSSTDDYILGRSYSCLTHSTMSLTDELKDTSLDRLREGRCGDPSLKLNSSWHLSGSGYVSKEYIRPCPEALSLDSSHSSSQASYLNMFPDVTAESTVETNRPHLTLTKPRDDYVENSNDVTAKFYMASTDSPVLGESARTTRTADTDLTDPVFLTEASSNYSKAVIEPRLLSEDLTRPGFFSKDLKKREFFLEDINKQSEDKHGRNARLGLSENTQPASVELLSADIPSITDSESPSPSVFVFPEAVNLPSPLSAEQFATEYTSQSSQMHSLTSQPQSPEKSPRSQTQARKVAPLKSKPTDLLIVTPKLRLSAETCTKSSLLSVTCQTPELTNRNSEGMPTPDDGYSSSLNSAKLALHGSVGKSFELLPSKLEKNFQSYGTLSKQDESLSNSQVSGEKVQSSSYTCLSKPSNRTELGTPTGIVHRLKSEITLREQRFSHVPLSPNKETLRHSLSQPCNGSISKSKSFSCSESSPLPQPNNHSKTAEQNDNYRSCRDACLASLETQDLRSTYISSQSRQGCTREIVSDPGLPGLTGSLKRAEPASYSQALLRETRRSKTQLDSLSHPPETDRKYFSIRFENVAASRTSPLGTNTDKSNGQNNRTPLKMPLVKCASLPLKSPVTPSEKSFPATPMDYQAIDKSTLQSSENTTPVRRISPSKDLQASTGDNATANDRNHEESVEEVSTPNESDSLSDDAQRRSSKRRLCYSEPKIVTSNSSQHEIERTRSDISGIASKTTETDEEKLNEANKENVSRNPPLLKRISGIVQSSTPEKLSKRSKECVDSAVETAEGDPAPEIPDTLKMSVKNRDWHRELLEEYTRPSPASTTSSSSSSNQTKTATKKPSQRLAVLGPKISYTPMPIQAYQGSASKLSKGADKQRKP